jgi:hypothetical protein
VDAAIMGRLGKWGTPQASWPAYGRRRTFFLSEIDVHRGTLRALRLPEHAPAVRRSLYATRRAGVQPEQVPSVLPAAFVRR